jgi:hypothetical protein
MKMNYKKILKLVTLLITSLLIGYVSAQTYSELFMYATPITIGQAGVKFVTATNTTNMGGSINPAGTTVTFSGVTIEPGQTVTYDKAVNITSNASGVKNLTMTRDSITGNFSTNFDYINVTIIAANGTSLGNSIEIVSSGTNVTTTGVINGITNGETWTVRWIIKTSQGATNGETTSVTLKVKVE